MGVRHDHGGTGQVAVIFGGGGGIVLDNVVTVDFQSGSGVQALLDEPIAAALLHDGSILDIHSDPGGLLGGAVGAIGILLGIRPVIVLPGIVMDTVGRRAAGIGRIGAVGILYIDLGILLVSVEAIVRSCVEGSLGHSPVMLTLLLTTVPVVGKEVVSAAGGIVVHRTLAIHGLFVLVIGSDHIVHILGIDIAAQTHLINNTDGCFVGNPGSIAAVLLGDQHLICGQQAGGCADDHSLLVRSGQFPLHTNHKVQIVLLGALGGAVIEVGTADIVRIGGDRVSCLLGLDVGDRIVGGSG